MDSKASSEAQPQTGVEFEHTVKPEPVSEGEYITAYANAAQIVHTFYDFQFHFTEINVRSADAVKAEIFATIMMSPQHAKVFYQHLTRNLAIYEDKFGEIKIPPEIAKLLPAEDIPLST